MKVEIKKAVAKKMDELRRLDELYPNRHKEIHKNCCKHCPSNTDEPDPITEVFKNGPEENMINGVFVCAWRPSKLCKGICDQLKITENKLV